MTESEIQLPIYIPIDFGQGKTRHLLLRDDGWANLARPNLAQTLRYTAHDRPVKLDFSYLRREGELAFPVLVNLLREREPIMLNHSSGELDRWEITAIDVLGPVSYDGHILDFKAAQNPLTSWMTEGIDTTKLKSEYFWQCDAVLIGEYR